MSAAGYQLYRVEGIRLSCFQGTCLFGVSFPRNSDLRQGCHVPVSFTACASVLLWSSPPLPWPTVSLCPGQHPPPTSRGTSSDSSVGNFPMPGAPSASYHVPVTTHTHTRMRAHTHTHSLSHILIHMHTHTAHISLSCTHTLTHMLPLIHTHTHALSLSYTQTHTYTNSLCLINTLTHMLPLTHTHTHALSHKHTHTHPLPTHVPRPRACEAPSGLSAQAVSPAQLVLRRRCSHRFPGFSGYTSRQSPKHVCSGSRIPIHSSGIHRFQS